MKCKKCHDDLALLKVLTALSKNINNKEAICQIQLICPSCADDSYYGVGIFKLDSSGKIIKDSVSPIKDSFN
ncbi:hypothetical protein [Clostridium perfringens]|uniref:Uncharacterized protein n=2 Tax=Clostridium perfringens TaxID=1502 RepID=A0A8H9QY34_CLOPF|nr:hypothetical protein [Clostridium perfringens]MDU7944331.1 hypothetical protein [Streptococcus salivarius]MDU7977653.1 hypothetical protein [Clostridioides difficile]EDT15807.1 hypothetical protein AC3_A0233 [Clostridium perfringens E str. JGS1987]EGS5729621.1 hypothetical protein [Clostridium perfringens]EGT0014771.1 hypothetical protein [Clostridium perfringens]